jgi:hypothetical protein
MWLCACVDPPTRAPRVTRRALQCSSSHLYDLIPRLLFTLFIRGHVVTSLYQDRCGPGLRSAEKQSVEEEMPPSERNATETEETLAALDLYFRRSESAIVCMRCGYAIQPRRDGVTRHLSQKHDVP